MQRATLVSSCTRTHGEAKYVLRPEQEANVCERFTYVDAKGPNKNRNPTVQ